MKRLSLIVVERLKLREYGNGWIANRFVMSFFLRFIHVPTITLLERVTVIVIGRST